MDKKIKKRVRNIIQGDDKSGMFFEDANDLIIEELTELISQAKQQVLDEVKEKAKREINKWGAFPQVKQAVQNILKEMKE